MSDMVNETTERPCEYIARGWHTGASRQGAEEVTGSFSVSALAVLLGVP